MKKYKLPKMKQGGVAKDTHKTKDGKTAKKGLYYYMNEKFMFQALLGHGDKSYTVLKGSFDRLMETCEPELSTGRKDDKKSKEIYNGDLVRCTLDKAFMQKAVFVVEIKYSDYAAAHKALIRKVERWEKYNVDPPEENVSERWLTTMVESFDFEVIGNIHENPELLQV